MSRRYVNVCITAELVAGMCLPTFPGVWHRTDAGLPNDAKHIGTAYDHIRNMLVFTFEHESFAEVPPGEVISDFSLISLSTVYFAAPMDQPQIDMVNRLTLQQHENAIGSEHRGRKKEEKKQKEISSYLDECIAGGSTPPPAIDPRASYFDLTKCPLINHDALPDHVREEKP